MIDLLRLILVNQPISFLTIKKLTLGLAFLTGLITPYALQANNGLLTTPPLNNFGEVGLLQLPSARFAEPGRLSFGISHTQPYNHYFLTLQSLPWLETTLSYTKVDRDNIWDKRLDTKLRLRKESNYLPQIALGIRSLTGTDHFSSEYLVSSKRYYDWDFTLGLGWGYLASGYLIKNPLRHLSSQFAKRNKRNDGGTLRTNRWLRGEHVSLFGGASYQTEVPGLVFKIEFDPNDHLNEPNNNLKLSRGPINIGLTYRPTPGIDLSLGLEGGDTFIAQAVLHTSLQKKRLFNPPKTITRPRTQVIQTATSKENALKSILFDLEKQGYQIQKARLEPPKLILQGTHPQLTKQPQMLGRMARIASQYLAEKDIHQLKFIHKKQGFDTNSILLPRWDFAKALTHQSSPEEIWQHTQFLPPPTNTQTSLDTNSLNSSCHSSITAQLHQHLAKNNDARYTHQLSANLAGRCTVDNNWSISGAVNLNITNNIDELDPADNSPLPAIRRNIQRYIREGKHGIENLALHYQWKPSPAWYARIRAGLLEAMYAGISTEFLYRPYNAAWALGVDVSQVKQRAYNKLFGLRDYSTTTGHISGYYHNVPRNIQAKLSIGRYLATDVGATLDLSHHFDNGAQIGAYATLSKKSGTRYHDKGVYLSLPFSLLLKGNYQPNINLRWHSLTQDHGQRLHNNNPLYQITQDTHSAAIAHDWHTLLD